MKKFYCVLGLMAMICVISAGTLAAAEHIRTVGTGQLFLTIEQALISLSNEYSGLNKTFTETERIVVYDGTYTSGSGTGAVADIGANANRYYKPTAQYRLFLEAAPNCHPVIDATGYAVGIRVDGQDYVTISGLIVKNSSSYGIQLSGNHGEVFNNVVMDTGDRGIRSHPDGDTTSTLENNVVHHNILRNTGSESISFSNVNNSQAYNNLIVDSKGHGFRMSDHSDNLLLYNNVIINFQNSNAFRIIDSANAQIYNNVIYSSVNPQTKDLVGICFWNISPNAIVKNNIIWLSVLNATGIYVSLDSQTGLVSDYNDIYIKNGAYAGYWNGNLDFQPWQTASNQDANSISADPKFINPGGSNPEDYKIQPWSPCADKGSDQSSIFTEDFWGTVRNVWDMGIYEVTAVVPVVSASVSGGHGGVDPASQTVSYDDSASISITPDIGYEIASITDNGIQKSIASPYVISNVIAEHTVVVTFAKKSYTLTYTFSLGGSITGTTPQSVEYGANGTAVTAVPDTNYHFDGWSDTITTKTRTDMNVTANISVKAIFAANSYTFTIEEAKIDFKKKPDDDKIHVKGTFVLGSGSDGIKEGESVTVVIGQFKPLAFKMNVKDNGKKWEFKQEKGLTGIKNMTIELKKNNELNFDIHVDDTDLGDISSWATTNPAYILISLQIGDDKGSGNIKMKVSKDKLELDRK